MKTKTIKNLLVTAVFGISVTAIVFVTSCTKENQMLDVPQPAPITPDVVAPTDLVSVKVSSPPVIDGVIDGAWDNSPKMNFSTTVPEVTGDVFRGYAGNIIPSVTLRSAYDDNNIYFVVEWADPTKSMTRLPWYFDPATQRWAQESGAPTFTTGSILRKAFYEDKIAFLWNVNNSVAGWNTGTCYKSCHTGLPAADGSSRHYTNTGSEVIDMWHWKSVRGGHNAGYQFEDQQQVNSYPNGRKGDSGNDVYFNNTQKLTITGSTISVNVPKYIIPGRTEYGWIMNDEVTAGTAKVVTEVAANGALTLSDATVIDPNTGTDYQRNGAGVGPKSIPGLVLYNSYTGSRGDISCKGTYTGTGWILELTRALKTTDAVSDVDFSSLNDQYFGFAIFENAQIAHSIKPNLKLVFRK
jgi:hypothetical protein